MSIPTLAYAERALRDTTLRQIDGDSTDAARWRIVKHVTGWQGGAYELGVKFNDMTAQLAQYAAALDDVVSGRA